MGKSRQGPGKLQGKRRTSPEKTVLGSSRETVNGLSNQVRGMGLVVLWFRGHWGAHKSKLIAARGHHRRMRVRGNDDKGDGCRPLEFIKGEK